MNRGCGESERAIERMLFFLAFSGVGGQGFPMAWVWWIMLVVAEMGRRWLVLGVVAAVAAVGGGLGKMLSRMSMVFAMDVQHEAAQREDKKHSYGNGDGDGNFGVPAQASASSGRGGRRIGRRCGRR